MRRQFLVWCKGRFSERYIKNMRVVLDRFDPVIEGVRDVDRLFAVCGDGARRELWFAVRNLLKFCWEHGWDKKWISQLMNVMPKCPKSGVDLRSPREPEVLSLLRFLHKAALKYEAFYNLILDSAVRPFHGLEILNDWNWRKLEIVSDGVYKYYANIEREEKHCWVIFVSGYTVNLIEKLDEKLTVNGYCCFQRRHKLPRPKHVQRFAYNQMRRRGVDRDVAEFLSGRKPDGVGEKHYAELLMLAEEQYPTYAKYVTELRKKAGLILSKIHNIHRKNEADRYYPRYEMLAKIKR